MLAVHKDRPFTLACGKKAYDTMLAEAGKLGLVEPEPSTGYARP
jgi:hypothetical protein